MRAERRHRSRASQGVTVLITAASRRVPLIQAFRHALRDLGVGGTVLVTDVNHLSPGVHAADEAHLVPLATDPGYLEAIEEICHRAAVDLVVPTIDDELPLFGANRARFEAFGARVAASAAGTARTCNDKLLTYQRLAREHIAIATTYLPDGLPGDLEFPVFVKPRSGRGGVGAFAATTARELEFFVEYVEDPIVQHYLDGPEFTIDVLCDFSGDVLSVVPRERLVVRAGTSDRGRTTDDPALIALGLQCARALQFVGAANVQCRVVDGRPTVFEVNPRFSGGIPLTIAAGADFPRCLVELVLGRPVAPFVGQFVSDLWMTNHETPMFFEGEPLSALTPGRLPAPLVRAAP